MLPTVAQLPSLFAQEWLSILQYRIDGASA
jgi:hypothetical protein